MVPEPQGRGQGAVVLTLDTGHQRCFRIVELSTLYPQVTHNLSYSNLVRAAGGMGDDAEPEGAVELFGVLRLPFGGRNEEWLRGRPPRRQVKEAAVASVTSRERRETAMLGLFCEPAGSCSRQGTGSDLRSRDAAKPKEASCTWCRCRFIRPL